MTLGELLSSENETIKRNAGSILKQLQRAKEAKEWYENDECPECGNMKMIKVWRKENGYTIIIKESCFACNYRWEIK